MRTIALADVGLLTVCEAAALRGVNEKTIRLWVAADLLPVVPVGAGNRVSYLLRRADVKRLKPPGKGRPKGSKNKASAMAEK